MKKLDLFYNESPTKTKTRYTIVESAADLFAESGIDTVTILDVANKCNITPRNLYRYYNSKELLVIDTAYHFMSVYDFSKGFILDQSSSGIEQLKNMLETFIEHNNAKDNLLKLIKLIMYFDIYMSKMATDHPAFIKYTTEYVHHINDPIKKIMSTVLEKGIEDGSIKIKRDEIKFYEEYIIQSVFSILMRTMIKEHENKAINASLVEKHVEVILKYLSYS